MRKIFITYLLLATTAPSLMAQDKKAQAALDDLAKTTQSYTTVRIDFSYRMENKAQKINEVYKGTLISKGDKYRVEVAEQVILSDGKTVWTYLESANEVQISNSKGDEEGFTPTRFLQSWSKDYKPKSMKEAGADQVIELQPIKKNSSFNRVKLSINKARKQISSIQLFDSSGNTFLYNVLKFNTNQQVADNIFTFDPKAYPGVEVIDMR